MTEPLQAVPPETQAWVEIDTGAIERNISALVTWLPTSTRVMAVVKANAYGHGLVPAAQAALAGGAAWLGVARVEEALALRASAVTAPLLVLGASLPEQAQALVDAGISQTVSDLRMAQAMADAAQARSSTAKVHLKVDTGMGRVGVSVADTPSACLRLSEMSSLKLEGVSTHLAWEAAGDLDKVEAQLRAFGVALDSCGGMLRSPVIRHTANSAITLALPESHYDMVRVGLLTYGIPPTDDAVPYALEPAMALKARLVQVKQVPAGTTVSYGGTHTAASPARLAIVPVGYADGYSRHLSNTGIAIVRGQECPVVGVVCMDQTVIDVTGLPDVDVGEEAALLGRGEWGEVSVRQMARWVGGVPHQVVSQLGTRLPRVFLNRTGTPGCPGAAELHPND
jgi:alanine racemase